jgi:hypothetical protein
MPEAKDKIAMRLENIRLRRRTSGMCFRHHQNSSAVQELFAMTVRSRPWIARANQGRERPLARLGGARPASAQLQRDTPSCLQLCGFTDEQIGSDCSAIAGCLHRATATKIGLLEAAAGARWSWTDREMPLGMQVKLLHVFRTGNFAVGGTKPIDLGIRIIAPRTRI